MTVEAISGSQIPRIRAVPFRWPWRPMLPTFPLVKIFGALKRLQPTIAALQWMCQPEMPPSSHCVELSCPKTERSNPGSRRKRE